MSTPGREIAKLSPWQILRMLYRASAGGCVEDLLREYNVSKSTFYRWRERWGHEAHHAADNPALERAQGVREALAEAQDMLALAIARIDMPLKPPKLPPKVRDQMRDLGLQLAAGEPASD